MSIDIAGAFAAALAIVSALSVPVVRRRPLSFRAFHPEQPVLDDAGWSRPIWHWEVLRVACGLGAFAAATATPVPLVGLLAGLAAPSLVLRTRAQAARERSARATTRLLRATEGALRSTVPLPEALRRAAEGTRDPRARRPFVEALRAFDLGASLDEALQASASRTVDVRTRAALETLALGVGSRLPHERAAQLVGSVAERLAFAERLDDEIRARTSGLRSQVVLLALVVPAMALYLALTVPSLAATLASPIGRYVLVPAALALEVVGVVASRRMVRAIA